MTGIVVRVLGELSKDFYNLPLRKKGIASQGNCLKPSQTNWVLPKGAPTTNGVLPKATPYNNKLNLKLTNIIIGEFFFLHKYFITKTNKS
jgi:hypothetical protein